MYKHRNIDCLRVGWTSLAVLMTVGLFLAYSSVFSTDYLMNDEYQFIGGGIDPLAQAYAEFLSKGRPIFGFVHAYIYEWAGWSPYKVQVVRFVHWLLLTCSALLLFRLAYRYSGELFLSFCSIIILYCSPALQGITGYGFQIFANIQPSMWFSILAFLLIFKSSENSESPGAFRVILAAFCLMLANLATQTYAYFSLSLVVLVALYEWESRKAQIVAFLSISAVTFAISFLVFKGVSDFVAASGQNSYHLGSSGIEAASSDFTGVLTRAVNPFNYWSAFKFWSFPFPFQSITEIPQKVEIIMGSAAMIIWGLVVGIAFFLDRRHHEPSQEYSIAGRVVTLVVAMGFAAIYLIADSPIVAIEHREHMTVSMVAVVCIALLFSLHRFSQYFGRKSVYLIASILVAYSATGAQANVSRGIVDNRSDKMNFIREGLVQRGGRYETVFVVIAPSAGCEGEPCSPWMSPVTDGLWHSTRPGIYFYAMRSVGVDPRGKKIIFTKQHPGKNRINAIVVDWRRYVSSRNPHSKIDE